MLQISAPPIYGDTRFKYITTSRAMDAASGNVVYTGIGFAPKAFIVLFGFNANCQGSGVAAASGNGAINNYGAAAFYIDGNAVIELYDAAGTGKQVATVASWDADGVTLTWTKTAGSIDTGYFHILFFR